MIKALLFLIVSNFAVAGGIQGNGGFVVVCQKKYPQMDMQHAMFLDLYKAQNLWKFSVNKVSGADFIDIALKLTNRFPNIEITERKKKFQKLIRGFKSEALIENNLTIPKFTDHGIVSLPGEDCALKQLAYVQTPRFPGEFRYNIDKKIWKMLDDFNKAAVVFHEVSHSEGIEQRSIQYFVAHILGDKLRSMSSIDYDTFLQAHEMNNMMPITGLGLFPYRDVVADKNGTDISGSSSDYHIPWFGMDGGGEIAFSAKYGLFNALHWKGASYSFEFRNDGTKSYRLGWLGTPYKSNWRNGSATSGFQFWTEDMHLYRGADGLIAVPLENKCDFSMHPKKNGKTLIGWQNAIIGIGFRADGSIDWMELETDPQAVLDIPKCYSGTHSITEIGRHHNGLTEVSFRRVDFN